MIDKAAFTLVQPLTIAFCIVANVDDDLPIFSAYLEWKHRTPRRFPVVFGMKCTAAIAVEERTSRTIDIDVVVPFFRLSTDEGFAPEFGRRLSK